MTEDLHIRERALADEVDRQQKLLADLHAREAELRRALAAATKAEQVLRERLARERRQAEADRRLRQARAAASTRTRTSGSAGRAGQIIGGGGSWVCPVQGGVSFNDSWGAPRSGGRRHKGVDMMAGFGTPVVAVVTGSVSFNHDRLGGNAAYVTGGGNTYYYAHLRGFVGGNRTVQAGELIGYVGNTGDASGGPPHLHFEIRPGGGGAINPTPTVRAHC